MPNAAQGRRLSTAPPKLPPFVRRGSVFRHRRVRREALCIRVEVRDLHRRPCRSREVELRAARSGWRRGGWQAALTKPGHASTARWCGPGEQDGKEYARNRRLRLSSVDRLKPGGYGPGAVRTCPASPDQGTPGSVFDGWPGDHGEVLRGSRGDAAGTESGSSFVERITVNTGTIRFCPPLRVQRGRRAGRVDRRSTRDGTEPP